jgi:drug/metabolite transporter (DMT)-like permease
LVQKDTLVISRTARFTMPRHWSVAPHTLAILAVVLANALWGASIVVGKVSLSTMPPMTLGFLRCLVAALVLAPLLLRVGARPARGRSVALLGFTGESLFYVCYNLGLLYTTAANATLILDGGEPIVTALVAALVLRERLVGRRLAGVVTALAGVTTIVAFSHGGEFGFSAVGDGLMLGSTICWAGFTVLGSRLFAERGVLAVTVASQLFGLLFLTPLVVVELVITGLPPVGWTDLVLVLYLGAGCSALSYLLLGYGLQRLDVTEAAVLGNLAPLTGIVLAVIVLGEPLAVAQIAGGVLILAGVLIATRTTSADERIEPAARPAGPAIAPPTISHNHEGAS